jgi:hypothetical protein
MPSFRLGAIGLSQAEQSLLATLFRLHRVDPSFAWTLVDQAPFDALLVDTGTATRSFIHVVEERTRVKRLSAAGKTAPGEMPRPIRSDLLVNWLAAIEPGLARETASVAVSPATPPVAPSTASMPNGGKLFKLKRWPPPNVLARDADRIRMATLLSRKMMSLTDLTRLSRIAVDSCQSFLRELDANGLLSTTDLALQTHTGAQTRAATPHARPSSPAASARPGIATSLIHSIRRRFGIA